MKKYVKFLRGVACLLTFSGCVNITNITGFSKTNTSNLEKFTAEKFDCDFSSYKSYKSIEQAGKEIKLLNLNDAVYNGNILGLRALSCGEFAKAQEFFTVAIATQQNQNLASKGAGLVTGSLLNDNVLDYAGTFYTLPVAQAYVGLSMFAQDKKQGAYQALKRAKQDQLDILNHFASEQAAKQDKILKSKGSKELDLSTIFNETIKENAAVLGLKPGERLDFKGIRMATSADFRNTFVEYLGGIFSYLHGDLSTAKANFSQLAQVTRRKIFYSDVKIASRKNTLKGPKYVWVIYENGFCRGLEEVNLTLPFTKKGAITTANLAFSKLTEPKPVYKFITANGVKTQIISDMDAIITSEYKATLKTRLLSSIVHTLASTGIGMAANQGGDYFGLAINLFNTFKNKADVRYITGLPSNYQAVRIKNTGFIKIAADGKELTHKVLERNKNYLVYVKVPSKEKNHIQFIHD